MGRTFTGAESLYRTDSPPVTAPPFTVSAWLKVTGTQGGTVFSLVDNDNGQNRFRLNAFGFNKVEVTTDKAAVSQVAATFANVTENVWQHACGVWTSAASRAAFLNGDKGDVNTDSATPTGISYIVVGANFFENIPTGFLGDLAEIAVWNVALTDPEVLLLARGISPLRMRPGNLVAYYPLLRSLGVGVQPYETNVIRNATDRSLNNIGITSTPAPTADSHPPVQPMLAGLRQGRLYAGVTVVNLVATSTVDVAPSLGAPALGQKHTLAADALIGGVPTLPVGPMAQTQALATSTLAVPQPSFTAPLLRISNLLTASSLAVPGPTLSVPATFGQTYVLTAVHAPWPPMLGLGGLGQKHILVPTSFIAPSPAPGIAAFGAGRQLLATSIATSVPSLSAPAFAQTQALTAVGVTGAVPVLGVSIPPLVTRALAAGNLVGSVPVFTLTNVGLTEVLTAVGLVLLPPVFALPPGAETIGPPLVWLHNRLKRWSNDPAADYYDEDGTENEGPVQEAIFSNLNDNIELEISPLTLVGRTSPERGPAETIEAVAPLFLWNRRLQIDIHQLAEDLAGLEMEATLPVLGGVSADLNLLNDKILTETAARKAAVTTETNARAVADATLDARLVALETRSYVDRGGVALIAPENDFVHQVANDAGVVILNPTGNLARGTFKLPFSPAGRQRIDFIAVKSVNNLTFLTDNVAHTLANPPSGVTSGKCITAVFGPTLQTWLFFA